MMVLSGIYIWCQLTGSSALCSIFLEYFDAQCVDVGGVPVIVAPCHLAPDNAKGSSKDDPNWLKKCLHVRRSTCTFHEPSQRVNAVHIIVNGFFSPFMYFL